jgi:hypothetical protein
LSLLKTRATTTAAADLHRRLVTANKGRFTGFQGQTLFTFTQNRFAFYAEDDRRALLVEGGFLCREIVQEKAKSSTGSGNPAPRRCCTG